MRLVVLSFVWLAACAEVAPNRSPGGDTEGGDSLLAGDADETFPVVFNEVHAIGDDWLELANASDSPVSLGGFRVADSDANGDPRLDEHAVSVPSGFELGAHAYLLVVLDDDAATPGLSTDCLGAPSVGCLHGTWGVSATSGEQLFLVDADGVVRAAAAYPSGGSGDEHSFGRLPDATGEFTDTTATPGEANEALD